LGYFLGIDAGTTRLKAALFHENGYCVAIRGAEYNPIFLGVNMVELDAAEKGWCGNPEV